MGRTGGREAFHVTLGRPASRAPGMSGSGPTQVPTSTAAAEALLSRHACLRARPVRTPARPRPLARPQPFARILLPTEYLFTRHDFPRLQENLKLPTVKIAAPSFQNFLRKPPSQPLPPPRPAPKALFSRRPTRSCLRLPRAQARVSTHKV